MFGKPVANYTFKKKDMAVTMKARSTVTIEGEVIPVDPLLMFQPLISTVRGLGADLWFLIGPDMALLPDDASYVLDGGWLLHRVSWTKGKTCKEICDTYVEYVLKLCGVGATIVFDGYDGKSFTKATTHFGRTKGKKGISVHFTGEMKLNMKKNEFLTNLENKQWFLKMLVIKMNEANLNAVQSSGDADVLIVETAVSLTATKPTVIIGEDTGLLILLRHHARNDGQIIFFTSEQKLRSKRYTKLCFKKGAEVFGHEL